MAGEGQFPRADEGQGKRYCQAGSYASGYGNSVTTPGQHLRKSGDVRQGHQREEGEHHRLFQRECCQDQHEKGHHGRDDGELSTVPHVTHVLNHPRGAGYFST
ncbi:hypothetical protein M1E17_04130 [Arthrobacter sp. D1-29]